MSNTTGRCLRPLQQACLPECSSLPNNLYKDSPMNMATFIRYAKCLPRKPSFTRTDCQQSTNCSNQIHINEFVLADGSSTSFTIHQGYLISHGTAVAQWLRCCATNQKATGSIPAGVSGFFIDIKSF